MNDQDLSSTPDIDAICTILATWAETTRTGQLDHILDNHDKDVVIYDVLPPMQFEGAEAYRKTWGDWQPKTPDDVVFALQDLVITASDEVAFAYGLLHCGGTTSAGIAFDDTARATFCLEKHDGTWRIAHQHISKPFNM